MASLGSTIPRRQAKSLLRHWPAVRNGVGLLLLAALAFAFLVPILWMTVMSFQEGGKMFDLRTEWIPKVRHFENYSNALSWAPFGQYFLNSGIVSLSVMAGNVVFCTLAGYGLAKFRFLGSGLVLLLILSTLMPPLEVTLVPTFLIVHKFDWINSYQGIVAPLLIDAFGVFLMRQSIISIPTDYRGGAH
jgi:ABC-type glycerol-3-phosphate transport system permease component